MYVCVCAIFLQCAVWKASGKAIRLTFSPQPQKSVLYICKMKAIAINCATGASVPPITSGRVRQRRRKCENDPEIQVYLAKFQDLVPLMGQQKHKLSKLEVIQNVIDYICELQNTLANADISTTTDS